MCTSTFLPFLLGTLLYILLKPRLSRHSAQELQERLLAGVKKQEEAERTKAEKKKAKSTKVADSSRKTQQGHRASHAKAEEEGESKVGEFRWIDGVQDQIARRLGDVPKGTWIADRARLERSGGYARKDDKVSVPRHAFGGIDLNRNFQSVLVEATRGVDEGGHSEDDCSQDAR
jgi:uncharacterized small protein (DUF1192 family)